jgi:hypothetical protein
MRIKHKGVDFRISRRTLWVGMQAYPLQMVTRVRPIEYSPNRRKMILAYGRRAGAWIGLAAAGLLALACLGSAVPIAVHVLYAVVVLGMLTFHTVRLFRNLTLPTLYVLSVATAGTAHAALVSTDRDLIHDLTYRVVDAIDNPAVEYAVRVDNIEIVRGDKIDGDKYEGDHVEGDKSIFSD